MFTPLFAPIFTPLFTPLFTPAHGKAGDESTLMANWAAWKKQYDTRAVGTARAKAERLRCVNFGANRGVKWGVHSIRIH